MNLKYLLNRIQDVKIRDILQIFPMLCGLVCSPFYRKRYKHVWLICEEKKEARDNGFWFFKRMLTLHPEQECIYAIDKSSVDYEKVKNLGEVIQYGSIRHWIVYFCCEHNISSQKGGKPNAALCAFIELNNWYNAHNIFLQHGIIINDCRWLYADRSRFQRFVTSAYPEWEFINKKFGYDKGVVCLTGMPRFDGLHDFKIKRNQILIMPSWRSWFTEKSSMQGELNSQFIGSNYLQGWKELLENPKFNKLIREYNLEVIFYPHRNLQFHLPEFRNEIKTEAKMVSWEDYDIQELLKTSEMMITDYSSVFLDMSYMKKPVIFYQFDLEDFRKAHYSKGYFDYSNNPFGNSYDTAEKVIEELKRIIKRGYKFDESALQAYKLFFPYNDTNNSERVYRMIKECK